LAGNNILEELNFIFIP